MYGLGCGLDHGLSDPQTLRERGIAEVETGGRFGSRRGPGGSANLLLRAGCPWLKSSGEWSSKRLLRLLRALTTIRCRFTILVVGVRKGKREEGTSIGKRREASDIAPPPSTILSDAAWAAWAAWAAYSRPADSLVTLRSTYFLLH